MEEIIKNTPTPILIGYVIAIISLLQFFVFVIWKRNEVLPDLRGKDKIWQFIELSGIVWLLIFPPMVMASGLGLDFPTGAWTTMDVVYFINILGKGADKFIQARFGVPVKEDKNND
jgi:amino acid transporter